MNIIAKKLLKGTSGFLLVSISLALAPTLCAQAHQEQPQDSGTSTDLFIMLGSDFVRPGLAAKANYNIGIGHTFGFLKKDPFGDELTFGHTYEDAGSGFWHSQFGSHTECAGIMKNFGLPKTKRITGYTWIQTGDHELHWERRRREPSLQRRVSGCNRPFQRPQFDLDSGELQ